MDAHERLVISELLTDFAVNETITPKLVHQKSWERFLLLEENIELQKALNRHYIQKGDVVNLALTIHKWLFDELYTFAGRVRLSNDPQGGRVHFGAIKSQKRTSEFNGESPNSILEKLGECQTIFLRSSDDKLTIALNFYQRFVRIHPFYDANGRIARLVANCYLSQHGFRIGWNKFDGNQKFLKKLNWVHKSQSEESKTVLHNYVRQFYYKISTDR